MSNSKALSDLIERLRWDRYNVCKDPALAAETSLAAAEAIERLVNDVDRLGRALEPFSNMADEFGNSFDGATIFASGKTTTLTVADLRAATIALGGHGEAKTS